MPPTSLPVGAYDTPFMVGDNGWGWLMFLMIPMLKVPARFFHTATVKEAGYAMCRRSQASESSRGARSSVATGALVLIPLLTCKYL